MSKSLATVVNIIRLMKDSDVKLSKKALFLVPVAYLIFPFDLVGDFFPVLGQLDDIAVFVLMWPILKNLLAKYQSGDPDIEKENKDPDAIDIDDYTVE
ncbi:YkvA family protein [Halanaerobium saccharolyticum]|uniref:YkvA family protein n=1 Tax=Halanaerobium saccharolyticum TaxID=43595 RepID=UPI003FCDC6D4